MSLKSPNQEISKFIAMEDPLGVGIIGIVAEFLDAAFVPELVVKYHHNSKATLHIINLKRHGMIVFDAKVAGLSMVKQYNICPYDIIQFTSCDSVPPDEIHCQYVWDGKEWRDWSLYRYPELFVLHVNPDDYLPLNFYDDVRVQDPYWDTFRKRILVILSSFEGNYIRYPNDNREFFIFEHPVDKQTYIVEYFSKDHYIVSRENVKLMENK